MNNRQRAENGRPRIVIVGAGFGGLWATQSLADAPVELYLVDRHNYHTFLPLLYQVAAAELEPAQIGYPIRAILRRMQNVHFVLGEVTHIDVHKQIVHAADTALPYEYLILATGSVTRFFGIPGAEEHGFPLKTMEDGIRLRNHILQCFEKASQTADPQLRRQLLTFVVVGGGATGVEYAGALAELIYRPLAKDYPHLDLNEVKVMLVEAADSLLTSLPEHLSQYTLARLRRMKVEVHLQTAVSRVNGFGWLACWLEGCAYGREAVLAGSVWMRWLTADLPDSFGVFGLRYQTQLGGLILSLLVFVWVWWGYGRWTAPRLFWLALFALSTIHSLLHLGRGDVTNVNLALNVALALLSFILLQYHSSRITHYKEKV